MNLPIWFCLSSNKLFISYKLNPFFKEISNISGDEQNSDVKKWHLGSVANMSV